METTLVPWRAMRATSPRLGATALGLVVITLALSASPAAAASHGPLRLSPQGFGPIHFGMDADAAEAALGRPIEDNPSINGCGFWEAGGLTNGVGLTTFEGRLGYALLYKRGPKTTRGIEVGDGLNRLRHRYRGRLHRGRSASLGAADLRLFSSEHVSGATYELEFDIVKGRVAFIGAGTRHTIETFGECA